MQINYIEKAVGLKKKPNNKTNKMFIFFCLKIEVFFLKKKNA